MENIKQNIMHRFFLTITGVALVCLTINADAQQTITKTMLHDSVLRTYILYIPANYSGSSPVPLLFNFHGRGSSATAQMLRGDFRPIADTAGFIIVYPQGTLFGGLTSWNVGGEGFTLGMTTDDLGFTEAMIDTIASNYYVDLSRVYSAGFSNGGFFSFELACQLGSKIAAIGSVGGSMTPETLGNCNPQHPTPVIQIHGTTDPSVRYYGTTWSVPVLNAISYWTIYNSTNQTPVISNLPDLNSSDGSTVEDYVFKNGDSCTSVEHYKVIGGKHSWPELGGNPLIQNVDFNASTAIWNFVSQYDINGKIGCAASGIHENTNELNIIGIYPNPTTRYITVRNDLRNNLDYGIYSPLGEMVMRGVINSNSNLINLSSLTSGIYFLHIGHQTLKILKY
jgi:polyhydroxybutyrate depolymerase